MLDRQTNENQNDETSSDLHQFVFENFNVSALSNNHILKNSTSLPETGIRFFFDLQPESITVNYARFVIQAGFNDPVYITVNQIENDLRLNCSCNSPKKKLCEHEIRVLYNLMDRKDLRAFFDEKLRYERIKPIAKEYGLENESNSDLFFELSYENKSLLISPKQKELLLVNPASLALLENQLIPVSSIVLPDNTERSDKMKIIIVIGQPKYYDNFFISLFEAQSTVEGKIKNPLIAINSLDILWKIEDTETLKFYSAIAKFQNNHREKNPETDITGLKLIAKNPLNLEFYFHNTSVSENVNASSLTSVTLKLPETDLHLHVDEKDQFYEISGQLVLDGKSLDLEKLTIRYDHFVFHEDTFNLITNADFLRVIVFFRQHNQKIVIHRSKFEEFRKTILSRLENKIRLTYSYLKSATKEQLKENSFDQTVQKMIYLEDFGNYVLVTPVMKYGNVEVPVFSKKQIYSTDNQGNPFTVQRDDDEEIRFTAALLRQHKDFEEQPERDFFICIKTSF